MGRVYPLSGRERKCQFCSRVFRSAQAVRGHLRSCPGYEPGAKPAEPAEPGAEPAELRAEEAELRARPVKIPLCLLNWTVSTGRLVRSSFKEQNEMVLALRAEIEELDPLMMDRLWEDEELCWSFFIDFAHGQLAGQEAIARALACLPLEPGEGGLPVFDLKKVLAEVRRR